MKVSSKGKYALTLMNYLAKKYDKDEYISASIISKEENLSLKYLEKIILSLKKNNLIISERGIDGGYKLSKKPEEITIFDILDAVEDTKVPSKCVIDDKFCDKKDKCKKYEVWNELYNLENNYLKNKTLKDLMEE